MKRFHSRFGRTLSNGLLCTALCCGLSAEGQIQYVDIDPDTLVFGDGFTSVWYDLDVNVDGTADFRFQAATDVIPPFEQVWVQPLGASGNAVAAPGGTSSCCEILGDPLALKLDAGLLINAALNWRTVRADLRCDACGNWNVGETGYLALRVGSGPTAHYAWLRVTLSGLSAGLLKDYAWQMTPGVGIPSGATGNCVSPSDLLGESLDAGSAGLAWGSVSGALQYEVSWRLASGGPASAKTVVDESTIVDGLLPNQRYRWSVRSLCATDSSAFSSTREFGTSYLPRAGVARAVNELTPGFPAGEPDGLGAFSNMGGDVAALGDMNGDGRQDFAVSVGFIPSGSIGGVRVIFPGLGDSVVQVIRPTGGPVDIDDMVGLGDVDGNGAGDLALTEDITDEVWIMRLATDGTAMSVDKLLWAGVPVTGGQLAALGDVNGDGITELVVRQSGAAYVFFLDASGQAFQRRTLDFAGAGITGGYYEGMAGIGDVDGNGVPDLAVGDGLDNEDAANAGAIYIVRLQADGSILASTKLNGSSMGNWIVNQADDVFGRSLAGVGDLTGDGIPDLAAGAAQDNDPFTDVGSVLLIALNADGSLLSARKLADGQNGLSLNLASDDRFGSGLAWVGDTDGDGIGELLVGAPRTDIPSSNKGALYRINLAAVSGCQAPGFATVNDLLPNAVLLVWTAVTDAVRYEIEGRRLGGVPRSATRTSTHFGRAGLVPGESYAWRIRTYCSVDTSAWTALDTFTTPMMRTIESNLTSQLWPNPSTGLVWLSGLTPPAGETPTATEARVFDAMGRECLRMTLPAGQDKVALDLSALPDGLYVVQTGRLTHRLLLQR